MLLPSGSAVGGKYRKLKDNLRESLWRCLAPRPPYTESAYYLSANEREYFNLPKPEDEGRNRLRLSLSIRAKRSLDEKGYGNALVPVYKRNVHFAVYVHLAFIASTYGILLFLQPDATHSFFIYAPISAVMMSLITGFCLNGVNSIWVLEVLSYVSILTLPVLILVGDVVELGSDLPHNKQAILHRSEWSALVIATFILDALYSSRTRTVIVVHLLMIGIYATSVAIRMKRRGVNTGNILTMVVSILVFVLFELEMYMGRYRMELAERLYYTCGCVDSERLVELSHQRQQEHQKAEEATVTQSGKLVSILRCAEAELLTQTFEDTKTLGAHAGRTNLAFIRIYELLHSAIRLLLANSSSLFKVTRGLPRTPNVEFNQPVSGVDPIYGSLPVQDAMVKCPLVVVVKDAALYLDRVGTDFTLSFLDDGPAERMNLLVEVGYKFLKYYPPPITVNRQVIVNYLYLLQRRYNDVSYHNYIHAAMTAHFTYLYGDSLGLFRESPQNDEINFALMFAALAHDVGHTGRNSIFLKNDVLQRMDDGLILALFGTNSVTEHLHSHLAFRLAQFEGCNIFSAMKPGAFRRMKKNITQMILSTDMAEHYRIVGEFDLKQSVLRMSDSTVWSDDVKLLVRIMVLKAADVAHSCVSWDDHFTWSCKITDEFYTQGDIEKDLKYPISPQCDRTATDGFTNGQRQFFKEIVMPIMRSLSDLPHTCVFDLALQQAVENEKEYTSPKEFIATTNAIAPYNQEQELLKASLFAPRKLLTIGYLPVTGSRVGTPTSLAYKTPPKTPLVSSSDEVAQDEIISGSEAASGDESGASSSGW